MRDLFHLPDQNPLTVGGLAKFCNASSDGAINISCVWNNPQINFNGLNMRVNNINSGSSSTLFDFGIVNSSLLALNTSGRLVMGSNTFGPPSIGGLTLTMATIGGNAISFGNFGGGLLGLQLLSSGSITFSNTNSFGFAVADVGLYRGGIGILSQRYGANPQEFRLFNTHNGTNDEWGYLKWDSNVLKLGATKSGTGVMRNLMLESINRSAYIATPTVEQIRDILISFGLMAAS